MKLLNSIAALIVAVSGSQAFAAYSKLAECYGTTDKNVAASATLFVNKANDGAGIIVAGTQGGALTISDTKVDWNATAQGYPRFYDNDFDLDIIISDKAASADDILFGDNYVSRLVCTYKP